MFKRLKETILEIIQQADLILLGLCCAASVFGIAMIYSATRYNNDNRKIIVQTAALLIGIVVYFGISMIDLEMLIKRWKWIAALDVLFIPLSPAYERPHKRRRKRTSDPVFPPGAIGAARPAG